MKYNEEDNDDYLLENNLLGIQSQKELEKAESLGFSLRASELEQENYKSLSLTLSGFKNLHYYLFQDIYPFAGEFRNVQLSKNGTRFCQVEHLNNYADNLFFELDKEPFWSSLKEAAERLAYFKSELNMLHPFREGNGRTIRFFIYLYALEKGITWKYEEMETESYIEAMIEAVINTKMLKNIFLETIEYT